MRKINLKRSFLLLVLGLPLPLVAADALPKPFTFARYQPMMDRSPFAVATAVAAPVAAPNFAKDLYIANAARHKQGAMVTVASTTDKTFKKYLTTEEPVDGYSITNIEWSEKVGATKVTIAKDGQTATLGFNEALLAGPATGQNPMAAQNPVAAQNLVPQPQNPVAAQNLQAQEKNAAGQLPVPPGVQAPNNPRAMPVPMLPTPPPRVRGIIPRNPAGAPPTQPQFQQKQQQQPQPQLQQKPNS